MIWTDTMDTTSIMFISLCELLIEKKKVYPAVEAMCPLISFKTIYKDLNKIQIQTSDLDLVYK